jgi:2-isopropylmalate synthase
MSNAWRKYRPYPPIDLPDRTWPGRTIEHAPTWCSVDLRDGNQALVKPMGVSEKLRLFKLLVEIGLKEIEVAFPSASQTEFEFVRTLIEQDLIPDDVTIQVLTQAREHLIRRTFESLRGVRHAIVHLYNSTSTLQRQVVFGMSQDEILDLAVGGAKLIRQLANETTGTDIRFEYSPESFTGTELDFSLRISEAVSDVWGPTAENPMILNLPSTVELATPNVYADQIEWIGRHLTDRESIVLSVHTHNDRGCAVAAAELSQMAGADRVEGTLFGYGERTGNVDLVTLALNLQSQGIDPGLDLSRLPEVITVVTECTENPIHPRHPYAGELVFTAFSGSHQDAINKGMRALACRDDDLWEVPYLTIDPHDVGRDYEAIIRVNSQSGKGGIAYVLRADFGLDLPKAMHPEFAKVVQELAESSGKEVLPDDIWTAYRQTYFELTRPYELVNYSVNTAPSDPDSVECHAVVYIDGEARMMTGLGRGPMEAFCAALIKAGAPQFEVLSYHEHSLQSGASALAAAYVCVSLDGKTRFGASLDANLTRASLKAIVSALNLLRKG